MKKLTYSLLALALSETCTHVHANPIIPDLTGVSWASTLTDYLGAQTGLSPNHDAITSLVEHIEKSSIKAALNNDVLTSMLAGTAEEKFQILSILNALPAERLESLYAASKALFSTTSPLDRAMVMHSLSTLQEADIALILEALTPSSPEIVEILEIIADMEASTHASAHAQIDVFLRAVNTTREVYP